MKRKLVRVGNSLAITLPHELVKEFALRAGMEVDATVDPRDGSFVVRTGVKFFEAGQASPRFRKMVGQLVQERRELYDRLAGGAHPDHSTPAADSTAAADTTDDRVSE